MVLIFIDKADVAIFFVLVIFTFTEYIVGFVNMNVYRYHSEWYDAVAPRIKGMLPPLLFSMAWVIMYVLIIISLFAFYRDNAFGSAALRHNPANLTDIITVLFLYNIMAVKFWPYVLFHAQRTVGGLLLMLFVVVTGISILVLFGVNALWVEMFTFLPYTLWILYTLYINSMWLYNELYHLPINKH